MSNRQKILGMVIIAVVYFAFDTLLQAGFFKSISNSTNTKVLHTIATIWGPEDMEWDREENVVYISSTNRRAANSGNWDSNDGIYRLKMDSSLKELVKMKTDFKNQFHPHGISLFRENGRKFLYVVNETENQNFIELFLVKNDSLVHQKTFVDEVMFKPNDVAGVSTAQFYVTVDHGNRSPFGQLVEDYLRLPYSYVLYFNGESYKKVQKGMVYANGVQISKDGKQVFTTHTIGHELFIWNRNQETGNLILEKKLDLNSGLDNIDVDQHGNIWIASHPKLLDFVSHSKDSTHFSPSQIFKIEPQREYKTTMIFENDGSLISGASVAVVSGDSVIVGNVFDRKILLLKVLTEGTPLSSFARLFAIPHGLIRCQFSFGPDMKSGSR
jgi:arylesterase/paraoxonase